jgi:hypothetical protein
VRTTLLALALLLVACSDRDETSRPSVAGGAATLVPPGPDALVLRVARAGGVVRAYRYPALDSIVWRSRDGAPPVAQLLEFDPDLGSLVGISAAGAPLRIDLRVGQVEVATFGPVTDAASADGENLFAVRAGEVARFGAAGRDWTVPAAPGTRVFPQPDGAVLLASPSAEGATLLLMRPPRTTVEDSVLVEAGLLVGTAVGDRVYLGSGEQLRALRVRDIDDGAAIGIGDSVIAAVATPSGDRVIVAAAASERLSVVDRFEGKVAQRIRLPGEASALRMDPFGRVVLARALDGDSAWVVSLADGTVIGAVQTAWRTDLPFVGADDRIATLRGNDVVFVSLDMLTEQARVAGGGSDYWFPMRWNGFRPRAAGLDQPVRFRAGTMRDPEADSAVILGVPDSAASTPPDTVEARPASPSVASRPATSRFYVVLGSVGSTAEARDSASRVGVAGMRGRVLSTPSASGPVHLVVVGPFGARSEADQVRREVGSRAWVTEERP